MKTLSYNPSTIEVDLAEALVALQTELEAKLKSGKILSVEKKLALDNPLLVYKIQDHDKDVHEIVVKIIQRSE